MFDAFTSDPHYYHQKIIEYCNRPFETWEEMNEKMIKNYNDRIGSNDRVLWLGDTLMGGVKKGIDILSRLNGKKFLVLGNHDAAPHKMASMGFEVVSHTLFFEMCGRKIIANHYDQWKYRSRWDDRYEDRRILLNEGEILFHGHTHQLSKVNMNQVHLGVDAWNFAPAMREEVEQLVKTVPDVYSSKEFKEKEFTLFEYRDRLRADLLDPELKNPKFDFLVGLGWNKETKMREK